MRLHNNDLPTYTSLTMWAPLQMLAFRPFANSLGGLFHLWHREYIFLAECCPLAEGISREKEILLKKQKISYCFDLSKDLFGGKMYLCVSVLLVSSSSADLVTPVHLCLSLLLINLNCNVPNQTR